MKYFTTLKKLREHNACAGRYGFLAQSLGQDWDDEAPISLGYILETNGLDDAIWALRAVEGIDKEVRLFACDCAEHVLLIYEARFPGDLRPRNAIQASRDFANGKIKKEELDAALAAVSDAVGDAARSSAGAARISAWAVWDAALAARDVWAASRAFWDAARDAEKEWQRKQFVKYFVEVPE